MTFRRRFQAAFSTLRAATDVAPASHWERCSHCGTTTPWLVNALRGEFRCKTCNRLILEG